MQVLRKSSGRVLLYFLRIFVYGQLSGRLRLPPALSGMPVRKSSLRVVVFHVNAQAVRSAG
jgi:hypothetical protein